MTYPHPTARVKVFLMDGAKVVKEVNAPCSASSTLGSDEERVEEGIPYHELIIYQGKYFLRTDDGPLDTYYDIGDLLVVTDNFTVFDEKVPENQQKS